MWQRVRPRALMIVASAALAGAVACSGPDPAEVKREAVQRGEQLFDRKDYVQAAAAFQIAIDADPRDGELRLKAAEAYRLSGQWQPAAEQAIKAADLLPQNRDAQLLAMSMLLLQGRFDDVIARSSAWLRKEPDSIELLLLSANGRARLLNSTWALWKIEEALRLSRSVEAALEDLRPPTTTAEDEEASAMFRRALGLAPSALEPQVAMVNHLWAMGRFDDAEPMLRSLIEQHRGHVVATRALGLFHAWRGRLTQAETYLQLAAATGDRDARIALAQLYTRAGRAADALALLDQLIRDGDVTGELSVQAALVESRIGAREAALRRLDAILNRLPMMAPALRLKATILFAMSQLDAAAAAADAAVAADPRNREGRLLYGRILSTLGQPGRAFDQLAEAVQIDPAAPDAARELAVVALALGRDSTAVEYAREAVRHDPGDRIASVALTTALVRTRDFDAADKTLQPLLARQPAAPDLLMLSGQILTGRGQRSAARSMYLRVLQTTPESFDALNELVNLDLAEGQPVAARQRVERALAARPGDRPLALLFARTAAAAGDLRAAEARLRALVTTDAADVDAARALADILNQQGRRDEARGVLEEALAERPEDATVEFALASLLEEMGRLDDARGYYARIVLRDPHAYRAAHRLAALYAARGERLDQALALAQQARQAMPDDPAVSDTLGWVHVRRNLPDLALTHLEHAVRTAPASALFRYHLGVAYLRSGAPDRAKAELTRALQLDPAFAGADDARSLLSSLNR